MTNTELNLVAQWLPRTDLAVTPLVLGGNMLGSRLDGDASFALLDAYVEAGGTMVDTATVYSDWLPAIEAGCSERTIGRWLRTRPSTRFVVATKGGHPTLSRPQQPRLHEPDLRCDIERSLDRLGLSALPLWFTHRDDPALPVAEILCAVEPVCMPRACCGGTACPTGRPLGSRRLSGWVTPTRRRISSRPSPPSLRPARERT